MLATKCPSFGNETWAMWDVAFLNPETKVCFWQSTHCMTAKGLGHTTADTTSLPLPLMGSALDWESLSSTVLNGTGMPFLLNLLVERKIYIFTWTSFSVHNLFCWIILSNKNKWKRGILHCLCVHQLAVEQKRQVINISLLNTANKNKHLKPQMKRLHPHTCHKFNP